jgi:catechol 2,3-dioxygenase-like lactoylglutathione lyase family enzyme
MGIGATHLDHVSVIVTDVARARAFYGGVLGLTEIAPPATFDFVAIWYRLNGQTLHLLQKPTADPIGSRHFCLHVPDIAAARQYLVNLGIAIDETVAIPGCDRFFIRDPDGNRIEVLSWEQEYDPAMDGRYRV